MRFVVQQLGAEWLVTADGRELARFASQQEALADVSRRLQAEPGGEAPASLSLRYGAAKPH